MKPKLGNLDSSSSYLFSYLVYATISLISLVAQTVKCLPANAGDPRLIRGLGRSPGEGNGDPLQYSSLGNPMNREIW